MKISEFLSHFPGAYFQTFDDKKAADAIPRREEGKPELTTEFQVLNLEKMVDLNRREAGVFFTPNAFSGSRKADNCIGVNAWFVESDDLSKEEQWELINSSPLEPSLVIESGKSLHVYFLADRQLSPEKNRFSKIGGGLVAFFAGDPGCQEINRVLRIPGFYHNKKEPFMIKIRRVDWGKRYTEEQMLRAFPYSTPEKRFSQMYGDDLDDVKNVPIRDVLMSMGVQVKKNRVESDGKLSSMTIAPHGNYVHRFSGKPGSGSTIDVVKHFKNLETGPAIKWIRETFHLEPPKFFNAEPPKIKASDAVELTSKDLTSGIQELLDDEFYFTLSIYLINIVMY